MHCDFGEDRILAEVSQLGGLALDRGEDGLNAVYSSDEGLFIMPVHGTPTRLGSACTQLDIARSGRTLFVACAHRPDSAKDLPGFITLHRGDGVKRRLPYPIGRDHRGLSLSVVGDGLELAFHDGRTGAFVVRHARIASLVSLKGNGMEVNDEDEARSLSTPAIVAGAPHMRVVNDERIIAWSEALPDRSEPTLHSGAVYVNRSPVGAPPASRPERLSSVIDPWARPVIAPGGEVFFRDVRRPSRRPALFAQARRDGDAVRIGRAGERSRIMACDESIVSVTPRPYGRHDYLIAVHVLNDALQDRVAEQQVYEWAAQFRFADGSCDGSDLQLLVGERSRLDGSPAHLRLLQLHCQPASQPFE